MSSPLQYAVFGHPIAHSLSPQIHQAFADEFGIALEYRAIDAAPENFAQAVAAFFAQGGHGANVTLPHKATAFELADQHSPIATRVGTANVLTKLSNGQLAAHNTDGAGMVRDMLERHGITLHGKRVALLGAGGAARGVAWPLLDAGVATLLIANRSAESATFLAAALNDPARVMQHSWHELETSRAWDVVINATSAGTLGQALELPHALIAAHTCCYDLGYGKSATPFLAWAKQAGAAQACDGLGMLVETAADAFALWHGKRPTTEAVYRALRAAGH